MKHHTTLMAALLLICSVPCQAGAIVPDAAGAQAAAELQQQATEDAEEAAEEQAEQAAIAEVRKVMSSGDWLGGLRALFTEKLWTLVGLVLLGSFIGIGTTRIVKQIKPPLDDASPDVREERLRFYTLNGMLWGGVWTAVVVTAYISAALGIGVFVAITVALGLAVIAASITTKVYDLLDALWAWFYHKLLPAAGDLIVRRLKKMFARKGGSDD